MTSAVRKAVMAAGLAAAVGVGVTLAANPPFGGDDTGFAPPAKSALLKCENGVAKGIGKLVAGIIKCHSARVAGKTTNDAGENACEAAAITKFTGTTKTTGCGSCTNLSSAASLVESVLDSNNNKVYCQANGTPFGGDDSGNVPADAPKGPESKCAGGVAKAVSKAVSAVIKCHISRASGKTTNDAGEDACEAAALTKFTGTSTAGCDSCVSLSGIASTIETQADAGNQLAYCQSPSGAFLD